MKVAAIFCLFCLGPLCCLAAVGPCREFIDLPAEGTNSFLAYTYRIGEGECVVGDVVERCNSSITQTLSGRTWFIQDVKGPSGLVYIQNWLQVHNVQCPPGQYLHMFMQNLDTQRGPISCTGGDFVTVSASGLETDVVTCGNLTDFRNTELYNAGLGRIVDGNATVSFCSNGDDIRRAGFVLRATCLDPAKYNLPGCIDFQFFRAWDPGFVNIINNEFPTPERVTPMPHRKRSIERTATALRTLQRLKSGRLQKRFSFRLLRYNFGVGDAVTYSNMRLTLTFGNGSLPIVVDGISCLTAFNSLIGTRAFFNNSEIIFTGPGNVEVYGSFANLEWTINNPETFFLPNAEIMSVVGTIYDYIYSNWIMAYPILTEIPVTGARPIFPLRNAATVEYPYRRPSLIGTVFPQVQQPSQCRQAIRIEAAPIQESAVARDLKRFCDFFKYSCDLTLQVACRELNELDPLRVWVP